MLICCRPKILCNPHCTIQWESLDDNRKIEIEAEERVGENTPSLAHSSIFRE